MQPRPDVVLILERPLAEAQAIGITSRMAVLEGLAGYGSDYWPSLAIAWLEDGYPIDEEIAGLLDAASSHKAWSQQVRHKAFALLCRWKRKQGGPGDASN